MTHETHIRGYVRPTRAMSEAEQRALLSADVVYVEGKKETLADAVASLRAGEFLEIAYLCLLARFRFEGSTASHAELYRNMVEIEAKGIIIWEGATGWRSDEPDLRDEMVFRAGEMLRNGMRGRHPSRGRRPKAWMPEQLSLMEREWFSTKHRTDEDAAAALGELGIVISSVSLWRRFGRSRRPKVKT